MALDFSNDKSIFLQVASMIENDILRGILKEDEQILSTNELARLYNINPNTALKGVNVLFSNDILYKKRGVGMFVTVGAREKVFLKRREEFAAVYMRPMLREAAAIGLTKDDLIKMLLEDEQ